MLKPELLFQSVNNWIDGLLYVIHCIVLQHLIFLLIEKVRYELWITQPIHRNEHLDINVILLLSFFEAIRRDTRIAICLEPVMAKLRFRFFPPSFLFTLKLFILCISERMPRYTSALSALQSILCFPESADRALIIFAAFFVLFLNHLKILQTHIDL